MTGMRVCLADMTCLERRCGDWWAADRRVTCCCKHSVDWPPDVQREAGWLVPCMGMRFWLGVVIWCLCVYTFSILDNPWSVPPSISGPPAFAADPECGNNATAQAEVLALAQASCSPAPSFVACQFMMDRDRRHDPLQSFQYFEGIMGILGGAALLGVVCLPAASLVTVLLLLWPGAWLRVGYQGYVVPARASVLCVPQTGTPDAWGNYNLQWPPGSWDRLSGACDVVFTSPAAENQAQTWLTDGACTAASIDSGSHTLSINLRPSQLVLDEIDARTSRFEFWSNLTLLLPLGGLLLCGAHAWRVACCCPYAKLPTMWSRHLSPLGCAKRTDASDDDDDTYYPLMILAQDENSSWIRWRDRPESSALQCIPRTAINGCLKDRPHRHDDNNTTADPAPTPHDPIVVAVAPISAGLCAPLMLAVSQTASPGLAANAIAVVVPVSTPLPSRDASILFAGPLLASLAPGGADPSCAPLQEGDASPPSLAPGGPCPAPPTFGHVEGAVDHAF